MDYDEASERNKAEIAEIEMKIESECSESYNLLEQKKLEKEALDSEIKELELKIKELNLQRMTCMKTISECEGKVQIVRNALKR